MALITRIRNNSWLLIVVIGLALAAFVLMDMMGSGNRQAAGDTTLALVNGESINWPEFSRTEQTLYAQGSSSNTYVNKSQLWDFFVEKTLVGQYAEQLGLGVSTEELMELQFGNNLSPIISQRFVNQNTGQVDRNTLNTMRQQIESKNLDAQQREYWAVQEKEIVTERLKQKMNNMVSKGIYTPTWMAEVRNAEQKGTRSFDYVKIPYNDIADDAATVADEDVSKYLQANKQTYALKEETRVAKYTVFDIVASPQDTADIYEKMDELKTKLEKTEEDSLFIINQQGVYENAFFKTTQVTPVLQDTIMDLSVGSVYGPFLDNGKFQVIKVLDKKILPDSVRSRHILRQVQTQEQFITANSLIDSLIDVIESGSTTFEAAAQRFGTDGTRTKGGDLGFSPPGKMVKPFNDFIFYKAEVGKLDKVITQFGIHLVEVTDKKFETNETGVKIGMLFEDIKPSIETQNQVRDRVFDFLSQNKGIDEMTAGLTTQSMTLNTSGALRTNDYTFPEVGAGSTAREIVRWIFSPGVKTGESSPEMYIYQDPTLYYNSKILLVALAEVNQGDLPSVNSVRSLIEPIVLKEKKGEVIVGRLGGKDLNAAATEFGVEVQQVENAGLSSGYIAGIGNEPKVIGQAFTIADGEVAGPIQGREGVYYVRITNINDAPPVADLSALKSIYSSISKNQVRTKLWKAIRDDCELEDRRSKWY